MKLSLISFTSNGSKVCQKLHKGLTAKGYDTRSFCMPSYVEKFHLEPLKEPVKEWTKTQFLESRGIIFIGATGIAVRAIAPLIKDKTKDPAVLVIDELGTFVIPLLSGHIGGANELGTWIADFLQATPVITTATDMNHKFAVDVFARKNDLHISNMEYAKGISAAILNEEIISFHSDFPMIGEIPKQLSMEFPVNEKPQYGIRISLSDSLSERRQRSPKTLYLLPKILTLGIGCRKEKVLEDIENLVLKVLEKLELSIYGVKNVATIDLKKEEPGLIEFCEKYQLPMDTYSAEILETVHGTNLTESEFVKSITGVGNVCERAAILGSENGTILQKKVAENGVTVSVAIKEWSVTFE